MADKKEKVEEEVVEEVVEEPSDPQDLIGVVYTDHEGKEWYWTHKSGMDEPVVVYK
jgi:hypothetical protein